MHTNHRHCAHVHTPTETHLLRTGRQRARHTLLCARGAIVRIRHPSLIVRGEVSHEDLLQRVEHEAHRRRRDRLEQPSRHEREELRRLHVDLDLRARADLGTAGRTVGRTVGPREDRAHAELEALVEP
eukprot:scaffold8196_cov69-Phaeocystis_antarctica.AAC.3